MKTKENFYGFLFLILISNVQSESCTLRNPKDTNKVNLLNGISLLNNERFVVTSNNYTYAVTFCSLASKSNLPYANVIRSKISKPSNETTVLGRFNNTDIVGKDDWRIVTFGEGDVIHENGTCNNTKWKSLIIVSCDLNSAGLELIDPMNAGCFVVFQLKTSLVCHMPSQSWVMIFVLILFTALICYCVIGMAYKRFVTGAKGLEQIPNYDFWRNPASWTQDLIAKQESRRNEPWNQASHNLNDSADEPLLHP